MAEDTVQCTITMKWRPSTHGFVHSLQDHLPNLLNKVATAIDLGVAHDGGIFTVRNAYVEAQVLVD